MGHVASPRELEVAREARKQLALYVASRDLVELGAHQRGVNPALDRAIDLMPGLDGLVQQAPAESTTRAEACACLAQLLEGGA